MCCYDLTFYLLVTPWIVVANRYYIRNISLDGSHQKLIGQGFNNVATMDYDSVENKLYYADTISLKIYRRTLKDEV